MCQPHQLWRFPDFSNLRRERESPENDSQQQQQQQWKHLYAVLLPAVAEDAEDAPPELRTAVERYHAHAVGPRQCTSILWQSVRAPVADVWGIVRRFDSPQSYKHFVRSCAIMRGGGGGGGGVGGGDGVGVVGVGSTREIRVVSGLPAERSTERLEILDDDRHVLSFRVVDGDHRLNNYRSVTTLHRCAGGSATLVLESYVVDVPDGNTHADTTLFADTIVRCNLQSLAHLAEHQVCRHSQARGSSMDQLNAARPN